ncbi:MAG: GerMN domain-containing protein [Bacilli bacterium]|nr:GerMN domain-containing protein [Bacilli bacterium]
MLKKMLIKKIVIASSVLFTISLIFMMPKDKTKDIKQILEYTNLDVVSSPIFLLDSNNFLAQTDVVVSTKEVEKLSKELLEVLIKDGVNESKIPSGFRSLISSETKINSVSFENGVLKVDLSKELLDTTVDLEEKVIESIVYTLTNIQGIEQVLIYIDGEILTKLPKTNILLPSVLNRNFGINKEYDITSFKDINKVTVYYINKYNDKNYYVPVTKYINDEREKIVIIIDELTTSPIYTSNLMSFLNSNAKLLDSVVEEDTMRLTFNSYIFNDLDKKNILEEVIYTINQSINDNYNVKNVIYEVDDKEIYKSTLKTLE